MSLKLSIIGNGTLAAATRSCCEEHFDLTPLPISKTDIIWMCNDTPIEDDIPQSQKVIDQIERVAHAVVGNDALILVSSQLPVGTTKDLERKFPTVAFAYSPENIRVAHAVADFKNQSRIVVGRRHSTHDDKLRTLFGPFTNNLIITDPETAECVKHFLNCWLGMTIAFANEMSDFCKLAGADPLVVMRGLLTEKRISPHAPMRPGAPYGGGHLARDIYTVNRIARENSLTLPILASIKKSNDRLR